MGEGVCEGRTGKRESREAMTGCIMNRQTNRQIKTNQKKRWYLFYIVRTLKMNTCEIFEENSLRL